MHIFTQYINACIYTHAHTNGQAQSLGGLRGDLLKTMLDNDSDLEGGEEESDDDGEDGGRER